MATFLLDTGILLGYVRGAAWAGYVDKKFSPAIPPNVVSISVVSKAELQSLALRRKWGDQKRNSLATLLRSIVAIPISHPALPQKFAEIDAYNRRQHPALSNPKSGHTMGDNDTWIAATASVLKATLLTTDRDFDHLAPAFFNVVYIDQKLTPADV